MEKENPLYEWHGKKEVDYTPVIRRSLGAAYKVHPKASIYMVTDKDTQMDYGEGWEGRVETIRLPLGKELGINRARFWAAWSKAWTGPTLHLDTDVEIRLPFGDVFAREFDIGMTWRPPTAEAYKLMPINGGMFLVNPSGHKGFTNFMLNSADYIEKVSIKNNNPKLRVAGGEQLSFAQFTGRNGPGLYKSPHFGRIAIMECSELNRTWRGYQDWVGPGPHAIQRKGGDKERGETVDTEAEQDVGAKG